ncbi:protein pellino-like isoform X2 [Symsagittifera roscoffensis]|uniref:protein pellino-like isoform X2 n=1 Tax=Symsagittifera roscoffensis TaxID=84072 RepID=UPI00307B888B
MPEKLKRSFVLFLTDHNFTFSSLKWKWNAPQNLFTNSIRKLFSNNPRSSNTSTSKNNDTNQNKIETAKGILMRSDDFLKTSTLTSRDTNRLTQCDPSAPQLWDLDSLTLNDTTQELYGELVVFGTTPSRFPGGNSARRRSKLQLRRRSRPNGVVPHKEYYSNGQLPQHHFNHKENGTSSSSGSNHVVSYSLSRTRAYVVEYADCADSDMFQVGRSTESNIDMVLIDTVPGATKLEECTKPESTISRYACRIVVERGGMRNMGGGGGGGGMMVAATASRPRIYAAGFDHNRSIQLGEKALKWQVKQNPAMMSPNNNKDNNNKKGQSAHTNTSSMDTSQHDGLTTNGVLILNPDEKGSFKNSVWREVSICGHIYTMRESKNKTVVHKVPDETNELRDGCLIDLCGTTLLWRSADNAHSLTDEQDFVEKVQRAINNKRPQCPISFNTLYLPKSRKLNTPFIQQEGQGIDDHAGQKDRKTTAANRRSSRTPLPDLSEQNNNDNQNNNMNTSTISRDPSFIANSRPYACFPCGHVYGYFDAPPPMRTPGGGTPEVREQSTEGYSSNLPSPSGPPILEGVSLTCSTERECPLCREKSVLVALSLGDEPAFHMDSEEPTYAFNPCGHTCSYATAKHWSSVLIPSSNGGKKLCPFCATTTDIQRPYVPLIFQDRFI